MTKTIFKKIQDFFSSGGLFMNFLTTIIIIINISSLLLLLIGGHDAVTIIMWVVCDAIYIFEVAVEYYGDREEQRARISQSFENESNRLYLCGFSLDRYWKSHAFRRFGKWQGDGFCWVLAAIGMFLLKDNKTAKLCKGTCYQSVRCDIYTHYWVEFYLNKRPWVLDLCWVGGFINRKLYYKQFDPIVTWTCSYEEFWSPELKVPIYLYENMLRPETSYVFDYLTWFFWNEALGKGFDDRTYHLRSTMAKNMCPILNHGDMTKVCSPETLRDFVKNPKRKQPKARTQRIARCALRYFNQHRAKKSSSPETSA